jgi:NAD(P)H-dependent FMN reductase
MPYPDSEYPSILRGRDKRESQRLLAAAPEMLASLKAAKNELIDLYEAAYPDDESENDTTAVIDRVIAAIDAAEGRE